VSAPNVTKALEGATAAAIVQTVDIGKDLPRLRTFLAVDGDGRWSPAADRVFPIYELRGAPPTLSEEDGATLLCPIAIRTGTNAADDKTHADLDLYSAAAQQVIDNLYAQFKAGTPGEERKAFDKHLEDQETAVNALIDIGGFSHGDSQEPFEEDGVNWVVISLIVHYSREDFK
jgi:hypothetical protein